MLAKLGLNPETKKAYMPTICNNSPTTIGSRGKKVGGDSNTYKIGVEIRMREDGNYVFDTWTIEQGFHVMNSHAIVDSKGTLLDRDNSQVNCFGLGWVKADQAFIHEMIEELQETILSGLRAWQSIEL